MVNAKDRTAWKAGYFVKIAALLNDYPKCFIVKVDNVGSKQMQQIRMSLRGTGVILMGKNTMMRKAIRAQAGENPQLDKLMPHLKGNVGFVFTREDLIQVREKIQSNKVEAPAKAGALAPCDVIIPGQNTGLGPEKTSFFQALQIQTKISKGTIEMLADVHLIKKGDKVGASEAALLNMLKISPFTYGLEIEQVYDSGTVFEPSVLDITQEDLRSRFMTGVRRIAAISIAIGRPTMAAVPHMIANGFKNVLAIAVVTDITFKEAEKVKEYLKDPSKFASAVAAAPAAPAGKQDAKAAPAKKEEAKPESEDEGDGDMGLGLFD